MKSNIILNSKHGKPITVDLFYKNNSKPKPIVVFAHGFKGFKDWGHFNKMGEIFAEADFVFVKFNFSHNGTTQSDPENFTDLEAFGQNNFIKELEDLQSVIDWTLSCTELKGELNTEQLSLIGHSRGGGICILKAAEDQRVKKLITWASVSSFIGRHKQKTIETWKKDGVVYAINGRTKQSMPMYYQFYETILNNKERLNINHAVKKLEIPFLIVHGTNDEAVPFHESEELRMSAKCGRHLVIEDADHTFGVKHPFNGILHKDADNVIQETIRFLQN